MNPIHYEYNLIQIFHDGDPFLKKLALFTSPLPEQSQIHEDIFSLSGWFWTLASYLIDQPLYLWATKAGPILFQISCALD